VKLRVKKPEPKPAVERPATSDPARSDPVGLVRIKELQRTLVPLSRTSIWRHCKAGTMPKPVRLSQNAIAWRRDEVEAWIRQRERTS
jgi:prophage regulatory protein